MSKSSATSSVWYWCVCLLVLTAIPAFNSFSQPRISHKPLLTATQNEELEFTAIVSDSVDVTNVELYYRISGTGAFSWLRMAGNGNYFSIRLPRQFVTLAGLDYYIIARNRIGRASTVPATAPAEYFEIMVRQDDTSPLVLSRYPGDGDTVATRRPVIRIGFYEESSTDIRRTRVLLDSVDVTEAAHILASQVSYTPAQPLAPGVHHVQIVIPDGSGNTAAGSSWSFIVKPEMRAKIPLKVQLTPSVTYGWSESRPTLTDARTYSADLAINATQQIGDFTIGAHGSVHTDQTLFNIHGRKSANLQNLVIAASELPFTLLWGNYYESFSELGLNNISLKGLEGGIALGPVNAKGFSGTTTQTSGNTQRFEGFHSQISLASGTTFTGFFFSGQDIIGVASGMVTGFRPVKGTVIGVGSTIVGIPSSQLSFELAQSNSDLSTVLRSADNAGYAGTIMASTSLLGLGLSSRVQYVDDSFHNPGNLFLQTNCLTTSTSASTSFTSYLSSSAQYSYTRRGVNADTAAVPTDEMTTALFVSLTPLRVWSISTSVSQSVQKSDAQTLTAKDAESIQASLSSSVFLENAYLNGGYTFSETQDKTSQSQSSRAHSITGSGSYRAGTYFTSSLNATYSNSTALTSGVATDCYTATLASTIQLDASGRNSLSLSTAFNRSRSSDGRSQTRSTSVQASVNSNLGFTMASPPQLQFQFGWSENADLSGGTSTTNQLQFNLSLSWNFNLSL